MLRDRILRATRLDARLYEEIESDRNAWGEASAVVLLSSLAAGLGGRAFSFGDIVAGSLAALVSWGFWGVINYIVGTKLLPETQTRADALVLLRAMAFASAPGVVRVLGLVPGLRFFVFPLAEVWLLVAMVLAVRQAFEYTSTLRAAAVCCIGFSVHALLRWPFVRA